jgi:hypothetical protein
MEVNLNENEVIEKYAGPWAWNEMRHEGDDEKENLEINKKKTAYVM